MYYFSNKSKQKLSTVDKRLQRVVHRALELGITDFGVQSGKRTLAEQRKLVAKGASQTLKSKHIDGVAVDLIPFVNGRYRDDWAFFYPLAEAMQKAAKELNIPLRWGGCWDYINDKEGRPEEWVKDYVAKRRKQDKKAFIDGYHFDLGDN